MGDPANFNLWGERSTPEYLLPERGFDTCTRVVSAIESPHLFFSPQKAKNDDKVTFLERIFQRNLVTFGNFCTFVVEIRNQ